MQPPVPVLPSSFTLDDLALLLAVALVAGVAFLVARRLLLTLGLRLVARANTRLAAALQHQRVFPTLALLAPALIVAIATPLLQRRYNWTLGLLEPLLDGYVIVVIALTVHNLLGALDELITAQRTPSAAAPVRLGVPLAAHRQSGGGGDPGAGRVYRGAGHLATGGPRRDRRHRLDRVR